MRHLIIHGAGHENGRRAGTENVAFDVALGKACEVAQSVISSDSLLSLTDYFLKGLKNLFGSRIVLNGHPFQRLPNTLNLSFLDYNSDDVIVAMADVAVSKGSACHSGLTTISPVLKAMGVTEETARGAIRFSLGRFTTRNELDVVIENLSSLSKG